MIRDIAVGDRPVYIREYVDWKLLHRCQHVVASDIHKSKGQLANVCLTHSKITDHLCLHHGYSYETYLEKISWQRCMTTMVLLAALLL